MPAATRFGGTGEVGGLRILSCQRRGASVGAVANWYLHRLMPWRGGRYILISLVPQEGFEPSTPSLMAPWFAGRLSKARPSRLRFCAPRRAQAAELVNTVTTGCRPTGGIALTQPAPSPLEPLLSQMLSNSPYAGFWKFRYVNKQLISLVHLGGLEPPTS
jgi:hypothetical protein